MIVLEVLDKCYSLRIDIKYKLSGIEIRVQYFGYIYRLDIMDRYPGRYYIQSYRRDISVRYSEFHTGLDNR